MIHKDTQGEITLLWMESQSPHETSMESEKKVRNSIDEKLQMDLSKIEVEGACRTGISSPGDRPRSIEVKFLRLKDKVAVLERVKNLRRTNIFLNEDLSEAVR